MFNLHLKHTVRAFLAVALFGLVYVSSAHADFGFAELGGKVTGSDGLFSRQAGAHADLETRIEVNTVDNGIEDGEDMVDGNLRDVKVDLPPGFIGDPTMAPTCDFTLILQNGFLSRCPIASQVGVARIIPNFGGDLSPIYNMARPSDAPALFAFTILGTVITIEPRIRPEEYGVSVDSLAISHALTPIIVDATFWGVPADHSHDAERLDTAGGFFGVASPDVPKAFLSNATSCPGTPDTFTASIDSWQHPGAWVTRSFDADRDGTPFLFTGCEAVPFHPSADLQPHSQVAAAPMGLDLDLEVPQSQAPGSLASAHVRKTVVSLPEGMTISPAAAAGQGACSEAQIGLGSNDAPTCPESSRLGTVSIKTPVLDEELEGGLYLAEQEKNPFGSLLAAYLAVKGPGFWLKLPGKIEADPADGQLTTTFDDLPQLPYEKVAISLRGGAGAPLVAPTACGTYQAKVQMTSWSSSEPVTLDAPIAIDQSCGGGGFAPSLKAGTTNPVAGAFSPFLLRVIRGDGEQNVSRIEATLPEGLLAKLAGVPLCGDADAASGTCPAASQVGTTTVAVGAGPTPLYVPEAGKAPTAVYLAGPYKGAPYSLVVKVPAQAGPFDLGTVAVRNALRVDPTTTQVTAESDPLPQILRGIPIAYRDIRVEVTRNEFTVNPTSCREQQLTSTLTAAGGATAGPSARFQVAGCERLAFKPELALGLAGQTKRGGNPALKAVLTQPKGENANIARTQVVLPKAMFIDQSHVNNPCTRVQFAADACPAKSILGTATAWSPLLERPLTGPVYFRSNGGERKLPDLVADLDGQIHVTLVGFIDSVKAGKEGSRVRTRFQSVPDAPVSKFVLQLKGGKRGLLQNSVNLCKVPQFATVKADGQNGKAHDFSQKITTGCGKGAKRGGAGA